ncbi:MAG: hypothetical protein ACRDGL_11090, partial [Candidatus Limnocylindrales bacterium]
MTQQAAQTRPQPVAATLLDEAGDVIERVERSDVEARLQSGRAFWLDLPAGGEQLAWLHDVFGFHPLAVDAAHRFGVRPKLEDYGGYVTLVLFGSGSKAGGTAAAPRDPDTGLRPAPPARQDGVGTAPDADQGAGQVDTDQLEALSEVHVFLSERFIVSVHRGTCPAFVSMLSHARGRRVPTTNPAKLFYLVADTLVDSFFPI